MDTKCVIDYLQKVRASFHSKVNIFFNRCANIFSMSSIFLLFFAPFKKKSYLFNIFYKIHLYLIKRDYKKRDKLIDGIYICRKCEHFLFLTLILRRTTMCKSIFYGNNFTVDISLKILSDEGLERFWIQITIYKLHLFL